MKVLSAEEKFMTVSALVSELPVARFHLASSAVAVVEHLMTDPEVAAAAVA